MPTDRSSADLLGLMGLDPSTWTAERDHFRALWTVGAEDGPSVQIDALFADEAVTGLLLPLCGLVLEDARQAGRRGMGTIRSTRTETADGVRFSAVWEQEVSDG